MQGVNEIKKYLTSQFKMKDLSEVDTILRIKVKKHIRGFALCQSHYIDKSLTKFNHLGIKEVNTPCDISNKLIENFERSISQLDYASVISSLMYDMYCTKPGIAFVVCKISRYTHNPSTNYWRVIKKVLGYFKRTKSFAIL